MAYIPGGWKAAIVLALVITSVYLAFLAMLPLTPAGAWGNPFEVEMTVGPAIAPGLSSWARLVSTLVLWMPVLMYETLHTKAVADEGGTVFGGADARAFVRWARVVMAFLLLVHTVVNWWILGAGYILGLVQCFNPAPVPLWCDGLTVQAWGATIAFGLLTIILFIMLLAWFYRMFIAGPWLQRRRRLMREGAPLVGTAQKSGQKVAMRFLDNNKTA